MTTGTGAPARGAAPLSSEGRHVFGNSSHITILEKEAELYLASIRDFLERRVGA